MAKTQYFNSNNQKALDFINDNLDAIYSYLMADPSKTQFNHITTIPVSQRNDSNGWANFRLDFNECIGMMQSLNVRVETGTFQNDFYIQTSKVNHLLKSDLLLFPGKTESSFYMSFLDNFGNRNWLTDKRYFRRVTMEWATGEKTYNYYNLDNLVANNEIIEILVDNIQNKIVVISNLDFLLKEENDTRVWKDYIKYNIDTSHITHVQYDGKQPNTIFWCMDPERYTRNIGTTTAVSSYLENISSKDAKSIYQQITRAYRKNVETGKTYSFKVPANKKCLNNINFNPEMFDENGNITIYVSNNPSFDVIKNKTEKITDDIKVYRKVWKWIKENPGRTDFPKKWTEEDLAIANEIMNKRNIGE